VTSGKLVIIILWKGPEQNGLVPSQYFTERNHNICMYMEHGAFCNISGKSFLWVELTKLHTPE